MRLVVRTARGRRDRLTRRGRPNARSVALVAQETLEALALLARLDQAVFRGAPGLAPLVQLCGTALLLLLPAAAMGATLPFLSAHAERSGARLSTLYALNTLGASPQDLQAILQAMKAAGSLKADLQVI